MDAWRNQLFFGVNLEILRGNRIPVESVDLIYLDPPFNSNATYTILFADKSGEKSKGSLIFCGLGLLAGETVALSTLVSKPEPGNGTKNF